MNFIKRLVPVLSLIMILLFSPSCCSGGAGRMRVSDKELSVSADISDESLFISAAKRSEMKKVASSGMLEMYIDEKTMSVCIYDTISKILYRSLPEKFRGEKTSTLTLGLLIDGREYNLSSQSDSLSFNCTEYEETKDGIIITYNFRRSLKENRKLDISVPVSYVLTDGMLTVSVDCGKIYNNDKKKTVLCSLEILPFFGADDKGAKGDYILLPDGCGTILDLSEKAETFDKVSLKVYGEDLAVPKGNTADVLVGAFGRKCGEGAFVCLVSEGDSICEIKADKALKESGYNRAGALFEITSTLKEDKYVYVSDESYEGNVSLSYRFLNGDNADYVGMASAVRELLIRQGKLRENGIDENREYPFNLTLVMSEMKESENGKESLQILTGFNECYELLSSLKAKGFGSINVRLKGVYKDAATSVEKELGTKKELSLLSDFAGSENIRLYADYSLMNKGRAARTISAEKLPYSNIASAEKSLDTLIGELRKQNFDGICINDAAKQLVSDYSGKNSFSREDVKNSLSDILASVYASKEFMVETGNLYSVKYACGVINIPACSSLSQREYFTDVPFIQTLLHGIVDYSLEAANLSGDSTVSMLKAAEYGALPHYEWYGSSVAENDNESKYYYMNSIGEAKAYYDKMKSDFAPFRNRRITGHEMIEQDVYLTRFGEDCSVYVNYSEKAVNVGGVTVDAKSYAAVN